MTDDPRGVAWEAVHEALPARWRVGPPTYDPGREHWRVTAMDALRRRLRLAYLEGAEDDSRRALGRGLSVDEQERVLARYEGG